MSKFGGIIYDQEHYDNLMFKQRGELKQKLPEIKEGTVSKLAMDLQDEMYKIKSDGGSSEYYKIPEYATELKHLISYKKMNFNVGNIFKAAYRLGEKEGNDLRYDLNKILFFAQSELDELDRLESK